MGHIVFHHGGDCQYSVWAAPVAPRGRFLFDWRRRRVSTADKVAHLLLRVRLHPTLAPVTGET
jgi:hypothetical protein